MPRFRLRISLLSALLLMTILGMAIVIAQLWREVDPLRAEVRRLRTEVGYLTIDDPNKAYAIAVPTDGQYTWKWRVYLPPGRKYTLHERSGRLPSRSQHPGNAWFDAVLHHGTGSSSSGSAMHGEFTMDAKLLKQGDQWVLATKYKMIDGNVSATGGGSATVHQPSGEWLSDTRAQTTSSDVSATSQSSFEPSEPILLLHMMRPVITETPDGGYSSTTPQGAADGIAVWIEQHSAKPASSTSNVAE